MTTFSTSDLAKASGMHPNTVRRYAERGILPPVARAPNGYRRFTQHHLDCMRLAAQVYGRAYPGKALFDSGRQVVATAATGDMAQALSQAHTHLALVLAEHDQANLAADLLEHWAAGAVVDETSRPLRIGEVARLLGVSTDVLRNWDRNGLLDVPRNPANGYRQYEAPELGRLRVIRMLSLSGYSTSAILRMMLQLNSGQTDNLRHALDTPRPDEDAFLASDRWLSTLAAQETQARTMIVILQEIVQRHPHHSP